ncbi:uncharacterized protein PB18E9.04c-like [Anneissia japonica]|uniref:uncharacterized protein PB18E9.04c-like n=1 Tax=Anneissia japonica TaxID=1529436 RepID=UPI00142590A2|nr:uncharacterized protein PB18E9.04c-like [Anneissia japonica]
MPTTIPNTVDYGHNNTTTMSQTNATTEIQTSTYSNTTQSHVTPTDTTRADIATTDIRLFSTNIMTSVPTINTNYKITTNDSGTSQPVVTTSFNNVTSNTGNSDTTAVTNQTTHTTTIQFLITSTTNITTAIPTTVESVFGTTDLPKIPSTHNTRTSVITNATDTTDSGTQMPTTMSSIDDSNQTFSTPDSTIDADISSTFSAITTQQRFISDTSTITNQTTTITELPSTRNIKTSAITNGRITHDSGTQILTTISSTADSNQTVSTPFNDASVSIKFTSSPIYTETTTNDSASTGPPGTTRIETDYTTVVDVSSNYSDITTQPRFTSPTNTIIYEHNTTTTLAQNNSDTITTTTPIIVTTNPSSKLITTSATQPYVATTIVATTENGDSEHTTAQHQVSTSLRPTTIPITVGYEFNTTTTSLRTNVTTHIQTSEFSTHSVTSKSRVTYTTKPNIATTDVTSTEAATTSAKTTTHYNKTTHLPTTESNFRSTTEQNTNITTLSRLPTHETTTLNLLPKTTTGNTPPTIVCPSDISSTDTSPDWELPIVSDDEAEVDCTKNPGDEYQVGSITKVTCTAIDSVGQVGSCSFYITVETVLSEEIANLTKNVNDENVEEVAIELEEIVEKAELEPADVQEVSNALETIANTESPNENVTSAVVGTVDAVIASDSSDSDLPPETTALILESFEQQISTAATDGQNYTQDEDTVSVRTLSFDSNLNYDVVFVVNEDKTPDICFDEVCSSNAKSQSVTLPKDLLSSNEGRTNISFTSFYNPNLFQSGTAERNLSSVIMSATIYNESLPEVFQNPVELVFKVPKSYLNSNPSCVFWNATLDGNGNWSIEGCKHIETGNEGSVTCHCTHLTNFAVLFAYHFYFAVS